MGECSSAVHESPCMQLVSFLGREMITSWMLGREPVWHVHIFKISGADVALALTTGVRRVSREDGRRSASAGVEDHVWRWLHTDPGVA